jgi:hypothetical protein
VQNFCTVHRKADSDHSMDICHSEVTWFTRTAWVSDSAAAQAARAQAGSTA